MVIQCINRAGFNHEREKGQVQHSGVRAEPARLQGGSGSRWVVCDKQAGSIQRRKPARGESPR